MTIPEQDPGQEASREHGIPPPASGILVIYGASGDLTRRKLIPALYNLTRDGFIPEHFAVIGIGRKALTDEALREHLEEGLREHLGEAFDEASSRWLMARVGYLAGDFDDPGFYERLRERLVQLRREHGAGESELHYLAIPPTRFAAVVEHLCAAQVITRDPGAPQRVVFEKPFGQDLASARALNTSLQAHLEESQIYRIDHYLGKETVQNLLVFRFGNAIFEPIWNRRSRRQHRGGLADHRADPQELGGQPSGGLSELCGWDLGTGGGRRVAGRSRSRLAQCRLSEILLERRVRR